MFGSLCADSGRMLGLFWDGRLASVALQRQDGRVVAFTWFCVAWDSWVGFRNNTLGWFDEEFSKWRVWDESRPLRI